jgi:4-hydroxy-4-methyl-2-oxoglutarate aldolase
MTPPSIDFIRSRLFASVISDCLDQVGLRHQALPSEIRPLDDALVMVGRARTAAFMEVFSVAENSNPYALEIELIDSLKPGDIPVFSCANPGRIAPWGELLTTAALARGASGALMDGCVRDIKAIRSTGFPVFSGGIAPLDTKGRGLIMALDGPIECGGVAVSSGDLVFGDADGVVVVPQHAEADVLKLAFEKIEGEGKTLADLKRGDKLSDVYARYGLL